MKNKHCCTWRSAALCGALLWLLSALAGCSGKKVEPESGKTIETNTDPNLITMREPGQFPLSTPQVRKLSDEIHVNGVINPDVNKEVPVLSLGGGRVVAIKVKLGDYVTKGQTLLLIDSPDLSAAFADYQKFKADDQLAQKQLARAQLLYSKGAIALADLEMSEDSATKAKTDLQAAIQHVQVMGGDINNPSVILPLRAPISGTIVEQNITGGTGVRSLDNQPNLFTIADLSTVWALCDVYQDMLPRVRLGDMAEVFLPGFPQEKFPGKVINISEVLDATTRAAKVRIELPNPKRMFRAGMYVTAAFRSRVPENRVVVPATAIVHLHDKDWVFVPAGGSQFRRTTVQLGADLKDGYVEIIGGLTGDDRVVTNALQFSSASEEQ